MPEPAGENGRSDSADTLLSTGRVQLHSLGPRGSEDRGSNTSGNSSSRLIVVTPENDVDDNGNDDLTPDDLNETDTDNMATVVSVKYADPDDSGDSHEDIPLGNMDDNARTPNNGLLAEHFKEIGGSQAGIVQMSSIITNPNLKRSESSELLNLTLHQCARDGNLDLMRRLVASLQGNVKKKINAHEEGEELSPLHYASRYNHVGIVKLLVDNEANVEDVDEEGATPLHFAARYKRMRLRTEVSEDEDDDGEDGREVAAAESTVDNSVVLYLVSAGANVNARDIYGCTPMHFAAMRGNEVTAKELLSCEGISVEAADKQNMTSLHMAASHNEVEICRMLIEAKAELRCADEEQATPLHYACMEGSLVIAQMLFDAGEARDGWVTVTKMLNDRDIQDNTPLHYAVENRSYEVTELCIERGADVNVTRNNYSTPLHLAAVSGDVRICELLIGHNARKDALDINQSTALHKAAAYNHTDVIDFLLEKGANINKRDKDNFSPLLIAACNGHAAAIQRLLACGAHPEDVDKNDKTALFWAAEEDNIEALKVLLNHTKARKLIDATDRYENTPLHIAAQNGYLNVVKLLLNNGADISKNEEEQTAVHLAAAEGKSLVVRELVRWNKMVINDEDEESNTALHLAALSGHNKVVQALIDSGADIEARNCSLWTPLDCAAARGWTKVVRVLLEADAPVDPMDKSKTTPLHLAASRGHVPVVNLLIQWHADVGLRDTDNRNCLDLAIDNGHESAAMAIINSDRWKQALRNQTEDDNKGRRNTPIRKLIRKMPDVAERVFNQCTTSMNHPDHPQYQITFNYEFLDDMYALWGTDGSDTQSVSLESIYDDEEKLLPSAEPYTKDSTTLKVNHPLHIMVANNQEDLLAHPLITSLLNHKWRTMGRYIYYLNLFIYCVFLLFLTAYLVTTPAPYSFANRSGLANYNGTDCEKVQQYMIDLGQPVEQHIMAFIGKYIIIVLAAIFIIREIFQIFQSKLNYLGWENLIEWGIYVFALLMVIDFENPCQSDTGLRLSWQWQLAAVAIFLAWIDLVLFMRKLPMFGIYIVMFTDICYTFIQFFPVFFLFIVAFGLAFFVLLSNQYAFRTVAFSIMKTSVMMIGEMEYGAIFLGLEGADPNDPSSHGLSVYYQGVTYSLFVIFLILLTIIIMNLLVGLAVDDIKAVQEKAVLTRLAMQVELALSVESILPQFIRRKFVVRSKTIYPNKYTNKCLRLCHGDSGSMSSAAITKALNPDLDDMERLEENQEKMISQIGTLRHRVKTMEQQNNKLESMLQALMDHQGIQYEDTDAAAGEDILNAV